MYCIRQATLEDAKDILAIYEPYILHSTVTYEYETIPLEEFEQRMVGVMKKHPWLVYEIEGKIVGYAYASDHLERAAFNWDCEVSVYIAKDFHGKGIASKLYFVLLEIVRLQGYYNVYSLIDYPNEGSMALHNKFGFTEVGIYKNTAFKHGDWRHLIVLEKRIRELSKPIEIETDWQKLMSYIQL